MENEKQRNEEQLARRGWGVWELVELGRMVATGAVDDGVELATKNEFLPGREKSERADARGIGGVQAFDGDAAQRVVDAEHDEVLEPIGDGTGAGLVEDARHEERLRERH